MDIRITEFINDVNSRAAGETIHLTEKDYPWMCRDSARAAIRQELITSPLTMYSFEFKSDGWHFHALRNMQPSLAALRAL